MGESAPAPMRTHAACKDDDEAEVASAKFEGTNATGDTLKWLGEVR